MGKGLIVEVLRRADGGDCTNGGITARHNSAVIVGGVQVFEADETRPALYVAKWYGRTIACPENLEALYPARPSVTTARSRTSAAGCLAATSSTRATTASAATPLSTSTIAGKAKP